MNIYEVDQKGPLQLPGYIDPSDATLINVFWGAPLFTVSTVYREGDICRPSVDNGYYYECTTNGKSDATEPTVWSQTSQLAGTAKFKAVPYNLFVLPGETLTASVWTSTDGATTSLPLLTDEVTTVLIDPLPVTITTFTLTNTVTKDNGEKRERSFKYKVRDQ